MATVDRQQEKVARFKKRAEYRTQKALEAIELLKQTANPATYSSTEEQRHRIVKALRDAVDELEATYANPGGRKRPPFTL